MPVRRQVKFRKHSTFLVLFTLYLCEGNLRIGYIHSVIIFIYLLIKDRLSSQCNLVINSRKRMQDKMKSSHLKSSTLHF